MRNRQIILAAGAHRSASTLQYEILRRLLTRIYGTTWIDGGFVPLDVTIQEAINVAEQRWPLAEKYPRLFKVHDAKPQDVEVLRSENRLTVFYTYRDPRSIVLSWMHRKKNIQGLYWTNKRRLVEYFAELEGDFLFWYPQASIQPGGDAIFIWKYDTWASPEAGSEGLREKIRLSERTLASGDYLSEAQVDALIGSVSPEILKKEGYIPEDHVDTGRSDLWKQATLEQQVLLTELAQKYAPTMLSHFC